jgi:hypothetical protein
VAHIADALVADSEAGPPHEAAISRIDIDYLERIGVADRLADWQRLAAAEVATT